MCDNKNELPKSEYNKTGDNTSTRLDLDITETTDSYPEFDFLDLLRNLQVKEKKKSKQKSSSEESTNKSNPFSEEDSDVEALAKLYEEKYGTCNDYAELGEGYDEEDSFIDNSDAVNDLVPSGIQTEFGGFYINRGKLNFVKEDNSSSSTSEDVDKFLAHNRLKTRRIISDGEDEDKEVNKCQSNNHSTATGNNNSNVVSNSNNANNNCLNSSNHCINNSSGTNNGNYNAGNITGGVIKSRKRSGEYQHKSKKIRKTATPKIPDHLLHKKPFPGSQEYRKNINEFKKNRLKTVDSDKKPLVNSIVNSSNSNNKINDNSDNNDGNNHSNNVSTVNNSNNHSNNNNCSEDDVEKEGPSVKKKPVKELPKERDGASEVIEAVATGADIEDKEDSSSSESSESSSSESDSESSDDSSNEKEKTPVKVLEESPPKSSAVNGFIGKDNTAKSFAHLSGSLKELLAKIVEISKEEKTKFFNSKLNTLLLNMDEKLRELPMAERNAVLEHVAEILQMKKDNITKRTKKLLVLQEESKMSAPLRKLKDTVAAMMPLLESSYFNEYTKAAGTSPQIYAELSRYYWSIDPSSLPQRKFPWNEELRHHLREVVQYRKNCYYIIRPRKESLIDYIRSFMETKVKTFWPKEWMTVEILLEEAQVTSRHSEEKSKNLTKILGTQNQLNSQKKISNASLGSSGNRKHSLPGSGSASASQSAISGSLTSRKSVSGTPKNPEVKSILIPRKTPSSNSGSASSTKSNTSSLSSLHSAVQGSRLQVSLNRLNVQEYLDRISGSQTSISRNSSNQQQISPNRLQQSVSPNRLVKTSSPTSVLNPAPSHPNGSKNTSPNSANKSISSIRNSNNSQSVLKTIEIHSNPVSGSKSSPNSVTISPVNESVFKDMTPSAEVLNLTKNSSVFISKLKDCSETKQGVRSNSPSIGIPLPSGITISPTQATPSTFLAKPQKAPDRNVDPKINVSITKSQESPISLTKEKRESVLNMNVKREGPLQNIPDCISVTSKVMPNERHKYEHVRKRALQEYHQQQQSPEKVKPEEKRMRTEENLLGEMDLKEDRFDDKNFSKIFDSVIAKTSETVRQSEGTGVHGLADRYGGPEGSGFAGLPIKNPATVVSSQLKNNSSKMRDLRGEKEKGYYPGEGDERRRDRYDDHDERSENMREQRVQMEMDRVMQNLVELSREKNSEYEYDQHMGTGYSSNSPSLKPPTFQEAFHKMFK